MLPRSTKNALGALAGEDPVAAADAVDRGLGQALVVRVVERGADVHRRAGRFDREHRGLCPSCHRVTE